MGQRKTISQKTRFEVFKRDGFRCQYCGRTAPDIILQVDHIVPVAEGGGNDMLNLITSCRDCNLGKGKTQLSDMTAIDRQRKQLEDMNEAREQAEMLIRWKRQLLSMMDEQVSSIDELIYSVTGYSLNDNGRRNMKTYIKRFGFQEVYAAAEIAFVRYNDFETAFQKIGGICYNRAKRREVAAYAEQDP